MAKGEKKETVSFDINGRVIVTSRSDRISSKNSVEFYVSAESILWVWYICGGRIVWSSPRPWSLPLRPYCAYDPLDSIIQSIYNEMIFSPLDIELTNWREDLFELLPTNGLTSLLIESQHEHFFPFFLTEAHDRWEDWLLSERDDDLTSLGFMKKMQGKRVEWLCDHTDAADDFFVWNHFS